MERKNVCPLKVFISNMSTIKTIYEGTNRLIFSISFNMKVFSTRSQVSPIRLENDITFFPGVPVLGLNSESVLNHIAKKKKQLSG